MEKPCSLRPALPKSTTLYEPLVPAHGIATYIMQLMRPSQEDDVTYMSPVSVARRDALERARARSKLRYVSPPKPRLRAKSVAHTLRKASHSPEALAAIYTIDTFARLSVSGYLKRDGVRDLARKKIGSMDPLSRSQCTTRPEKAQAKNIALKQIGGANEGSHLTVEDSFGAFIKNGQSQVRPRDLNTDVILVLPKNVVFNFE